MHTFSSRHDLLPADRRVVGNRRSSSDWIKSPTPPPPPLPPLTLAGSAKQERKEGMEPRASSAAEKKAIICYPNSRPCSSSTDLTLLLAEGKHGEASSSVCPQLSLLFSALAHDSVSDGGGEGGGEGEGGGGGGDGGALNSRRAKRMIMASQLYHPAVRLAASEADVTSLLCKKVLCEKEIIKGPAAQAGKSGKSADQAGKSVGPSAAAAAAAAQAAGETEISFAVFMTLASQLREIKPEQANCDQPPGAAVGSSKLCGMSSRSSSSSSSVAAGSAQQPQQQEMSLLPQCLAARQKILSMVFGGMAKQTAAPAPLLRGRVLLGDARHAQDEALLRRLKVTHVLNCAPGTCPVPVDLYAGLDIEYLCLDRAEDTPGYPLLDTHLAAARAFLDDAVYETRGAGCALVHCFAGINRSACIAVAYVLLTQTPRKGLVETVRGAFKERPFILSNHTFQHQLVELAWKEGFLD